MLYLFLLAVHLIGAVGMFLSWGMEIVFLYHLRHADRPDDVRKHWPAFRRFGRIGMLSMITAIAAGTYLMVTTWGPRPWITFTFAALAILITVGIGFGRRAHAGIQNALEGKHLMNDALQAARRFAVASLQIRLAIGLTIICVMAIKPDTFITSILFLIGILAGAALAYRTFRQAVHESFRIP